MVSITRDSLTHIFKTFPIAIFSVKAIIKTLHHYKCDCPFTVGN